MENKNTYLMYGLITGIIMVICNVILYITGAIFKPEMKFISSIVDLPFLVGIIMNAVAFSKSRDGFVTFGNVFGSCFKATLIIMAVNLVWCIISLFAFPEMKDKVLEMQRQQMMEKSMSDDQIDMAINMTRKFWSAFAIGGTILGTIILGAVFSLIGGAVAKKKGEPITGTNF